MNKEEYRLKDAQLASDIACLNQKIEDLRSQRKVLEAEYLAANATITIGQTVIYRRKDRPGGYTTSHPLNNQLCHVYEIRENYSGVVYKIRKARKDGGMAKSGPNVWSVPADELEVVKTAVVDRSNEGDHEDASVTVTLPCGHFEKFWLMGLTDAEYINRTEELKELEAKSE